MWNALDFRNGSAAPAGSSPRHRTSALQTTRPDFVFGAEAARVAAVHAASKPGTPLFLYLAFQSVHTWVCSPKQSSFTARDESQACLDCCNREYHYHYQNLQSNM